MNIIQEDHIELTNFRQSDNFCFNQRYKPESSMLHSMDIVTIAFYIILFVLAFMIARIIMRIMRGY